MCVHKLTFSSPIKVKSYKSTTISHAFLIQMQASININIKNAGRESGLTSQEGSSDLGMIFKIYTYIFIYIMINILY